MRKAKIEDKSEEARARSYVYGFLSLVYGQEPTAELLGQIREPGFVSVLKDLGLNFDEDFLNRHKSELLKELVLEYTRLFLGPGQHISPHESVHREGEGILWGNSTAKVKVFIESSGLKYHSDFKGMPDHISVELEFMCRLTKAEQEAREKEDAPKLEKILNLERRFIDEHISKWIPQFADKIAAQTKLSFYRNMATLTKEFIQFETEELNKPS